MSFPRPRQTAISVSIALAAMAYTSIAPAAQTGSVVSLESVTTLDPSRATPDSDAASFVSADRIEGNPEDQLHLYGNAEIRRAGTVLKGDRITYTQETDEVEAVGNARISRQGASFSGPSMRFKISPRTGDMSDAEYEYAPRNIRGCAKNIRFISGESTVFDDAKVTTCKRDDEAWFIKMSEIDEYDQTATGTNASLHFMGVPVFGSPWFSFPVSRERRSGFLVPTFGMSSTRGLDLAVPYYFNIAPNYDLTLTPRLMTKRGVMLDTEARFLYNNFETTVDYALMPDDKEMDDSRSSLHVDMSWRRDKLSAFVDYNRVSDDDFISDFSSNVRESSETVLPQEYALRYDETYWNTSINVKKNQALTFDHIDYYKPYERVPQITFNGYNGDQMASELNMQSKHSLEKTAAHNADCFTTVSDITARECEQLLEIKPLVTPNGFELSIVPERQKYTAQRKKARAKLLQVAEALTGKHYDDDTFLYATAGRNEFRNKGLDMFIDATNALRNGHDMNRQTIAFILVPAWENGAREDSKSRLEKGETQGALEDCIITHRLHDYSSDAI